MFEEINNDAHILRAEMDVPAGTLAIIADPEQLFEEDVFSQAGEYSLDQLPNFPKVKDVPSPVLKLIGVGDVPVLILHTKPLLETGYEVNGLAYPVRLLGRLGIRSILFCERADPVDVEDKEEEGFFLIEDHVNFMGRNPLVGPNFEAWGPRFPDMSCPYDPLLSERVARSAAGAGVRLKKAVYAGFQPEHLEDRSVYASHMQKSGATIAGSSLVQEVIVARHMGIRVCALAHASMHSGVFPAEMIRLLVKEMSGLY